MKKIFSKNEFVKNVVTLMTGTGIAQAIPIALSPVLTRIYTPEEFGLFALYTGVSVVLISLATSRYELAIMLPAKDSEAADIVKLAISLSILISAFVLIIVCLFGKKIAVLLGNVEIYNWLFFLPVSILIMGTYQSLNYWFNRKRNFKRLAKNRVTQSVFTGGSQVAFGSLLVSGIGLLFGSLVGRFITMITLVVKVIKEDNDFFSYYKLHDVKRIAYRYLDFPKFALPTALLNQGSMQAPNVLFTVFFSATYSGFFYLTQRVLQAPITLISTSVLDVFKEEASRVYRKTGQAKSIYIRTFKWLFLMSVIPSIFIYVLIEDLFSFVFGKEWQVAGVYAKIMLPALMLRFIANPLGFMMYVAEKQKWNLITMIFLAAFIFSSFYFADDHFGVVWYISISYIFYYLSHLLLSAKLARVF